MKNKYTWEHLVLENNDEWSIITFRKKDNYYKAVNILRDNGFVHVSSRQQPKHGYYENVDRNSSIEFKTQFLKTIQKYFKENGLFSTEYFINAKKIETHKIIDRGGHLD